MMPSVLCWSPVKLLMLLITLRGFANTCSYTQFCKIFGRYADDFIMSAHFGFITPFLDSVNELHPSLVFTTEYITEGSNSFLEMHVTRGGHRSAQNFVHHGRSLRVISATDQKFRRLLLSLYLQIQR